ncbi:cyclic nucleotide-binding domain-containing protein [Chitinimonas sp.]|uniref:Crp/Fnr family transcriptional regulator n=1 Tax=Chitinimonas sp. TaxID=1934313 RepID=UPI002F951FD1
MDFSSFFEYDQDGNGTGKPGAVFLGNLPEEDWSRLLSVAQRRAFVAGEFLVRQGEQSRAFCIVASGRLEVFVTEDNGRERRIYDIEPLSIFGEQAFFDGLPRSANVRAYTAGELFAITPDAFEILSARYPDLTRQALLDLGRILSLRLREITTFMLRALR